MFSLLSLDQSADNLIPFFLCRLHDTLLDVGSRGYVSGNLHLCPLDSHHLEILRSSAGHGGVQTHYLGPLLTTFWQNDNRSEDDELLKAAGGVLWSSTKQQQRTVCDDTPSRSGGTKRGD